MEDYFHKSAVSCQFLQCFNKECLSLAKDVNSMVRYSGLNEQSACTAYGAEASLLAKLTEIRVCDDVCVAYRYACVCATYAR